MEAQGFQLIPYDDFGRFEQLPKPFSDLMERICTVFLDVFLRRYSNPHNTDMDGMLKSLYRRGSEYIFVLSLDAELVDVELCEFIQGIDVDKLSTARKDIENDVRRVLGGIINDEVFYIPVHRVEVKVEFYPSTSVGEYANLIYVRFFLRVNISVLQHRRFSTTKSSRR